VLPFSHFARVAESINGSTPWDDVLVLAAMGLAALMLGAVGFWRRDLTVGAWTRLWRRHGPREAAQEALGPGGEMAGRRSGRAAAPLVAIAVAAFACIALSAIALWTSDDLRHRVRSAVGVDALEVSGTLAEGSAPVSPSAAGQVVAVNVGVGDLVAEGDVLLVLTGAAESPVRVAAQEVLERAWSALDEVTSGAPTVSLQDLRAALDRATDAAEAAEMEWDRARRADQNPSRAADLETLAGLAQTARRIAVARLALAEGHLSDADVRAVETAVAEAQAYLDGTGAPLALHSIRASRAGTVTEVLVTPTETITAGRAAVRISEPGTLEVAVRVSGDDAARITIGDEADVEVSGFDEPFQGEVIEVARTGSRAAGATGQDSDEEEHPFVVRIAVNASGSELRPGTNVDVRIPLD
jgi:multidrug efflux pump subunit AcrA (membrane-fusion protein)